MTRAFLLSAMLLVSNVVSAQQTDDDRARMHFQSGLSYYEQARYAEAAREFSEAYGLSQRPALLLNLSQAYERDLRFSEAIAELERYLIAVPESPQRRTVETRIARLRELQARVTPSVAPVPVNDPADTPEPQPDAAAAEPASTAPTKPTAADTTPTRQHGSSVSMPGLIVASAGGLLLAGSLVTGIMADSAHTDLETRCPGGACPPEENAQSDIDSGRTLAWTSTILLGGGVIAAAIGTVLILTHGGDDSSEPAVARVFVAPGEVGGVARIVF